jgi:hypothetical protein
MRLNRLIFPFICSIRARLVEELGEELRFVDRVRAIGDDRADAASARSFSIAFGVIALVGDRGSGVDVWTNVEQGFEVAAVARLAAGQMEAERIAVEIGLEMNLGREASPRAAERLAFLPPFAPAADTCARTMVESNICTRCAVSLNDANASKNASNTPLWLSREKRFQTLFQLPNSAGSARQVMVWTVK